MQGDSWPWKYLSDKMRGESSSWGEVRRLLVPWALLGSDGTQRCAVSTWDTKRPATPFGQTVRSKERYVTLRRGQTSGLWVEFRMELAWAGFEAGSCVAACGPHWSPLQEGVLLAHDTVMQSSPSCPTESWARAGSWTLTCMAGPHWAGFW